MVAKETKSECEVENKFTDRLEQIKAEVEKIGYKVMGVEKEEYEKKFSLFSK